MTSKTLHKTIVMVVGLCLVAGLAAGAITDGLVEYYSFDGPYETEVIPSAGGDELHPFWYNESPNAEALGATERNINSDGANSDGGLPDSCIISDSIFGGGWTSVKDPAADDANNAEWLENYPKDETLDFWRPGANPEGWTFAFWANLIAFMSGENNYAKTFVPEEFQGIMDSGSDEPNNIYDWTAGWAIWFSDVDASMKLNFSIGDYTVGSASIGYDLTLDTWHHYAATFDGTDTINVYYDGEQGTPFTDAAAMDSGLNPASPRVWMFFGFTTVDGSNYDYVDMQADDLALWNRDLTPEEVAMIYDQGTGGASLLEIVEETPTPTPVPDAQVGGSWMLY